MQAWKVPRGGGEQSPGAAGNSQGAGVKHPVKKGRGNSFFEPNPNRGNIGNERPKINWHDGKDRTIVARSGS